MDDILIKPEQLCIGLYIHLDLPWMKHPFVTGSFKIRNEQQLKTLKQLHLRGIRIDPARSDVEPLPLRVGKEEEGDETAGADLEQALWEEKRRRIEVLKKRRIRLNRCANRYRKSVGSVRKLMDRLFASPAEAMEAADDVVDGMVAELTGDQEVTVQLVNMKGQDENTYFHVINVAALSMVLGQKMGLDREQLHILGLGALFHDLGHQQIPAKVLRKTTPLTPAEEQLYRRHTLYGKELAAKIGLLPRDAVAIICQHHEYMDGSGYPEGLGGDRIAPLVRIITLVNHYDNLCNRIDTRKSLTPYEAVSLMYTRQKAKFDQKLLTTFISNLGVFPPGTVVSLSDGRLAAVLSINPDELLKPNVLVYDPKIPREEALILDLSEEELSITGSCRRADMQPEVMEYLNMTDNVSYFFDQKSR